MELDDLKSMWQAQDQGLGRNLKLNTVLLKEVTLGKLKSKLLSFRLTNIIELISYAIVCILLIGFLIDHFSEWRFSIPAMVLLILSGMNIYENIAGLEILYKMNYATAVTILQKKIQKVRKFKYWQGHLMLILTPLFFISLLIVSLKGLLNFDLFAFARFWWMHIFLWSAVGAVIVWLIVRNDYKELDETNEFLNKIKKFEEGE